MFAPDVCITTPMKLLAEGATSLDNDENEAGGGAGRESSVTVTGRCSRRASTKALAYIEGELQLGSSR